MIGYLFGQEKAAFFRSYRAVEKAQPVWATGDIRAKLWLETPRTGQECSRKRPLLPGILFQSCPHLLRLASSCTWNSAPIVWMSLGRACAAASCSLPLSAMAPLLAPPCPLARLLLVLLSTIRWTEAAPSGLHGFLVGSSITRTAGHTAHTTYCNWRNL